MECSIESWTTKLIVKPTIYVAPTELQAMLFMDNIDMLHIAGTNSIYVKELEEALLDNGFKKQK